MFVACFGKMPLLLLCFFFSKSIPPIISSLGELGEDKISLSNASADKVVVAVVLIGREFGTSCGGGCVGATSTWQCKRLRFQTAFNS